MPKIESPSCRCQAFRPAALDIRTARLAIA
jgi:hypothetical protein